MDIETSKGVIRAAALADDTVILEGAHGIGKSGIVKQLAEEDDYHLETLFLSVQEVGDLVGIPHTIVVDNAQVTVWSQPIWLKRMHEAAWPTEFELDDLVFHDKEFEKFVISRL